MRGQRTGELVFEDCEVPEENVLGARGQRRARADERARLRARVLAAGPYRHYAGVHGCRCCRTCMTASSSASPSAPSSSMQGKIADMYVTLNGGSRLCVCRREACDRGETTRKDAAGAILFAAEKATWMALRRDPAAWAAPATSTISATGRLLRDAKLYEIGAGTSEIRRWLIGRELVAEG